MSGPKSILLLISINLCRLCMASLYMFNDFICFDYYNPHFGVQYLKYFNLGYLGGGFFTGLFNFLLFDPFFIGKTFYLFLLTSFLSLYLT